MHMPEETEVRLNPTLMTSSLYPLKPAKFTAYYKEAFKGPVLELFS